MHIIGLLHKYCPKQKIILHEFAIEINTLKNNIHQ
jgi:hypothetical protein